MYINLKGQIDIKPVLSKSKKLTKDELHHKIVQELSPLFNEFISDYIHQLKVNGYIENNTITTIVGPGTTKIKV